MSNTDKKLVAYKAAWEMGARIREQDVLETIGAAVPTDEDKTLTNPAIAQAEAMARMGNMGLPGMAQDGDGDGVAGEGQRRSSAAVPADIGPDPEKDAAQVMQALYGDPESQRQQSVTYVSEGGDWEQREIPSPKHDTGDRERVSWNAKYNPGDHPRGENGRWVRSRSEHSESSVSRTSVANDAVTTDRKAVVEFGKSLRGKYLNADTGWDVHVHQPGIEDTVFRREFDYRLLPALPELIQRAVHFSTEDPHPDESPRVTAVHHFFAPVSVGKEHRLAKLIIKQYENQQRAVSEARFYNLSAKQSDRLATPTAGAAAQGATGASVGNEPDNVSIDDLIAAVKHHFPDHVPFVPTAKHARNGDVRRYRYHGRDELRETIARAAADALVKPPIAPLPGQKQLFARRCL